MKNFILFLTFFLVQISYGNEVAHYHIQKGKFHTGGVAQVEMSDNLNDSLPVVKLTYQIYKKILVPIPDDQLHGEASYELPAEFRDETGYMELESKGVMELPEVKLQFLRRVNWNGFNNAYQFLILPKNGKSKIEAIYHPSIPAAGWGNINVTFISTIPILNGYQVVIDLNQ